jgi:hypothetical protein
MAWSGKHYLITRVTPARYAAMSFGFHVGTFPSLEDAYAAVIADYEERIRRSGLDKRPG